MGKIAVGAGIAAAGAVAGGVISSSAAGAAAGQQAAATAASIAEQQKLYEANQNNLLPYIENGSNVNSVLTNSLGALSNNPVPQLNEQTLQNTPGYQFELSQGLQATQNSAAARGLGVSGAAMKGAASYATGLADSNWQNVWNQMQGQFQDRLSSNQNTYNMLSGVSQQGLSAASALAGVGSQTGQAIGNSLQSLGQSQSAGTIGSANALSGALGTAAQTPLNSLLLNNLMNNNTGIYSSGSNVGNYGVTAPGGYIVQ